MSVFVMLALLVCIEAQGTRETVFKQKGDDLLLNVEDVPENYLLFDWTFNKTVDLVRFARGGEPNIFPGFTGRFEFGKNFSVKLKNLQKADSGLYTARVITFRGEQQLIEYEVTVQEAPPAGMSVHLLKIVVFSVSLIVMVSAVVTVHLMEKLRKHR